MPPTRRKIFRDTADDDNNSLHPFYNLSQEEELEDDKEWPEVDKIRYLQEKLELNQPIYVKHQKEEYEAYVVDIKDDITIRWDWTKNKKKTQIISLDDVVNPLSKRSRKKTVRFEFPEEAPKKRKKYVKPKKPRKRPQKKEEKCFIQCDEKSIGTVKKPDPENYIDKEKLQQLRTFQQSNERNHVIWVTMTTSGKHYHQAIFHKLREDSAENRIHCASVFVTLDYDKKQIWVPIGRVKITPTKRIRKETKWENMIRTDKELPSLSPSIYDDKENFERAMRKVRMSDDLRIDVSKRHNWALYKPNICVKPFDPEDVTVLDLFSGIGVMISEFEKCRMNVKWAVEQDKSASETFQMNNPKIAPITKSIEDFFHESKNGINFLYPNRDDDIFHINVCPYKVEEIHFFKDAVDYFEPFTASLIILRGINGDKSKIIYDKIFDIFMWLAKMGYQARVQIVNPCDYGDAHSRPIAILFASSSITPLPEVPPPTHGTFKDLQPYKTAVECIGIYEDKDPSFDETGKVFINGKPVYNHAIPKVDKPTGPLRLRQNAPSPDIRTSGMHIMHYAKNRYISVREAAELKSFPKVFEFLGQLDDQYRHVGNSVPCCLAKVIAECISKVYFGDGDPKKDVRSDDYYRNETNPLDEESDSEVSQLTQFTRSTNMSMNSKKSRSGASIVSESSGETNVSSYCPTQKSSRGYSKCQSRSSTNAYSSRTSNDSNKSSSSHQLSKVSRSSHVSSILPDYSDIEEGTSQKSSQGHNNYHLSSTPISCTPKTSNVSKKSSSSHQFSKMSISSQASSPLPDYSDVESTQLSIPLQNFDTDSDSENFQMLKDCVSAKSDDFTCTSEGLETAASSVDERPPVKEHPMFPPLENVELSDPEKELDITF